MSVYTEKQLIYVYSVIIFLDAAAHIFQWEHHGVLTNFLLEKVLNVQVFMQGCWASSPVMKMEHLIV